MQRCRGFSSHELLVVIAIIGILMALVLPLIQQAREVARRSTCSHNMKQFVLALQHYHDVHDALPPGGIHQRGNQYNPDKDGRGRSEGWQNNWHLALTPWVHETTVLDSQKIPDSLLSEEMEPVVKLQFNHNVCPTNGESTPLKLKFDFAKSNYAACFGGYDQFHLGDAQDYRYRGAFSVIKQRSASFREITDGLTNTMALGEIITVDSPIDGRGAWTHPAGSGFVADRGTLVPNARVKDDPLRNSDSPAYCDFDNYGRRQTSCIRGLDGVDANIGLRSYHTGGVVVGMCDGSAFMMNDKIDPTTYLQLISIGGGEIIDRESVR